ncbi:hypothetical protein HFN89_00955 [Rhizobium laguerreae]|nr:hypothetical protein [Rhizobium laguerreae]
MKLNMHYPVLARGKPERSVKERMILLSDSADFEIPEYSERDIVRAVTVDAPRPFQTPAIYAVDDALYSRMSPIQFDESNFKGVDFSFGKHRAFPLERPWAELHMAQHEAIRQIRDDNGTQLSSVLSPEPVANVVAGRENVTQLTHRHSYRYKEIDEMAFVEARTKMQESVSRIIMVDGTLWRQCRPPVVCYSPLMGMPPTRAINVELLVASHFSSPIGFLKPLRQHLHIICGLNDTEEGENLARQITSRFPGSSREDEQLRNFDGDVIVHEPDLLASDAAALGVLQCAISASEWMATNLMRGKGDYDDHTSQQQRILRNVTTANVSDVLTLKGLTDGIARADTHGVDDALVDHVRAVLGHPMFFGTIRAREVSRGIIEACLDRWDNQPISVPAVASRDPTLS